MKKLLIAAIAASIASGAWALQSDREQQIEIHADQFNGDEVKQTAVYSGAVVVDQGSMRLTGDVLELRITPKGYRQATITGAPARFRQQRDPDAQNPVDEWMHAEAKRIVYDEETDKVTLTGGARLSRSENGVEKDMTQGERIVYDMRNARSVVEGGVKSGPGPRERVTTIIAPRTKNAQPAQREGAQLQSAPSLSAPAKP